MSETGEKWATNCSEFQKFFARTDRTHFLSEKFGQTNPTKTDQDRPKPTQTNQNPPVSASLEFVEEEEVLVVI